MNDNEIIKGLEKALTDVDAPIGEHWGSGFLSTQNIRDTLDLIHRQAAEKKELEIELIRSRNELKGWKIKAKTYEEKCSKLQRENSELKIELTVMRGAANSYRKESAELQREIESCNSKYPFKCKVGNNSEIHSKSIEDYDKLIADISSEARKEFAERVKKRAASRTYAQIWESDLDEVLAEMEEWE